MKISIPSLNELRGKLFIDGTLCDSTSGKLHSVFNPSTGHVLCEVGWGSQQDAIHAIENSKTAFAKWSFCGVRDRATTLHRIASLLREHINELAELLTLEQGKPLKEAKLEILYSADFFEWYAAESRRVYGDIIASDTPNKRIFVTKEPVGVVAAITPWNFPSSAVAKKVAAALAAGCTVIVKPAPETPLTALALASLCFQAGLPAGALNVVLGNAEEISNTLLDSHVVRAITFTGSTEVGKILVERSAQRLQRVTLELGGNAPFIVLPDADIELAVQGALYAKYRNGGQACIAPNRFIIHSSVVEEFVARFIQESGKLKVGDGLDPESDIGPLITNEAVEKIFSLVNDAQQKGAQLRMGNPAAARASRLVSPIVLTGITTDMEIWKAEIFGPVTAISTFTDSETLPTIANDTTHGLAAYLYGGDLNNLMRLTDQLHFGIVGVNDVRVAAAQAPFGGVKESGMGREGGKYGLDEYLQIKCVSVVG